MSFSQPNVVSLFYPRNRKGGGITADDLLASCMRMSPDRIIFGELRGSEAFFYIDQINTGHKGSITTIHANSAEKAVKRLIKLIKRSDEGKGFSNEDIREDIADEVDVIFQWQKHGIDHAYFPRLEGLDNVC
jgi:type IV secretion system protein VirB11